MPSQPLCRSSARKVLHVYYMKSIALFELLVELALEIFLFTNSWKQFNNVPDPMQKINRGLNCNRFFRGRATIVLTQAGAESGWGQGAPAPYLHVVNWSPHKSLQEKYSEEKEGEERKKEKIEERRKKRK